MPSIGSLWMRGEFRRAEDVSRRERRVRAIVAFTARRSPDDGSGRNTLVDPSSALSSLIGLGVEALIAVRSHGRGLSQWSRHVDSRGKLLTREHRREGPPRRTLFFPAIPGVPGDLSFRAGSRYRVARPARKSPPSAALVHHRLPSTVFTIK